MKLAKVFCTSFPILALALLCGSSDGASILFYWGFSGYSHRISVWPLVERLVENGHNVTFFSPIPPKKPNPNVTEINSVMTFKVFDDTDFLMARVRGGAQAIEKLWSDYLHMAVDACEYTLEDPGVIEWINRSHYDLIVINGLINDCAYGLVHKFKTPFIIYGPNAPYPWWAETFGFPEENLPEIQYHMPLDMTFPQKVWNALRPLYWLFFRTRYTLPRVEAVIREKLNITDMPPIVEMEKNASLILVYTNFIEDYSRSFPPSVVSLGGMHCTEDIKPLSKELTDFIDSGTEGFVYFSFGSHAQPESLPLGIKNSFFGAMERLNHIRFIVKWGEDIGREIPNVKIVTWAPQQDILAHPKIRGFISHGGLLGTQEALFHGVPMVVIPLFAEQDYNAERIHSRGRGLRLEICDLTQDQLEAAIQEIITDKSYRENTLKASKIFKDRPGNPLETAVWWVEYVLRHKDTTFLHSNGIHKTWYERRLLDIWGFIGLVVLLVVYSIYILIKFVVKKVFSSRNERSLYNLKKQKRL